MKEWLFNSFLRYTLSQRKWFREWYGGDWTRVQINQYPDMKIWVKGEPSPVVLEKSTVIEVQRL